MGHSALSEDSLRCFYSETSHTNLLRPSEIYELPSLRTVKSTIT